MNEGGVRSLSVQGVEDWWTSFWSQEVIAELNLVRVYIFWHHEWVNESPTCWIFTLSFSSLSNQKLLQTPLKGICVFIFLISPCQNVLFSGKSGIFLWSFFFPSLQRGGRVPTIYTLFHPPQKIRRLTFLPSCTRAQWPIFFFCKMAFGRKR